MIHLADTTVTHHGNPQAQSAAERGWARIEYSRGRAACGARIKEGDQVVVVFPTDLTDCCPTCLGVK